MKMHCKTPFGARLRIPQPSTIRLTSAETKDVLRSGAGSRIRKSIRARARRLANRLGRDVEVRVDPKAANSYDWVLMHVYPDSVHREHETDDSTGGARARAATTRRLYIWDWVGGGWNACHACTRAEAIARAKEMGLKIKPGSLHVGTNEEYGERLRWNWARR